MSFVDLATLALHRRHEMETRIRTFSSKCDQAINDIRKLKMKTCTFVDHLNCEPEELKDRFLACMHQLDEYMYVMTDINLAISKLDKYDIDVAPVQDTSSIAHSVLTATNLMDVLSEPAPSTSSACPHGCPMEKSRRKRVPKKEQLLIEFSSTSCSAESVPEARGRVDKETQSVAERLENLSVTDSTEVQPVNLPAQKMLEVDQIYPATIMSVDGTSIWVVIEAIGDLLNLLQDMITYYKEHIVPMTREEISKLSCCVFYDNETPGYFRALFIKMSVDDNTVVVFLVDTGEERTGGMECIQPLQPQFCVLPPLARCCHLADVDIPYSPDPELTRKQEEFLTRYSGHHLSMRVDDNTSESLGVYFLLEDNTTLNERMVQEGLALAIDVPPVTAVAEDEDAAPEHTDAVQAVTGYSNRDEIDICKHYKGGPEKSCFKGARCTKRHVLKHPDGWTLDRVAVAAGAARALPPPAPGTWLRVHVTYVCHLDRVWVQLGADTVAEELPSFGVVLPPATLEALVRDMNSPAARMAYKKLDLAPAPGELVAALYPPDDQWYRARVVCATRADQCVQVVYIDYGNEVWVKEDAVRVLAPRFLALPAQALRCRLAGVRPRAASASAQWAAAKAELVRLTLDRTFEAHVISCSYDELLVELIDAQGYSVAEQLEAGGFVALEPYEEDASMPAVQVCPA